MAKTQAALNTCNDPSARQALHNRASAVDRTLRGVRVTVPADSRVSIVIARARPVARQWTLTVSSLPRGRWQMLVGVTFVPDFDKEYFTTPTTDGTSVISAERAPGTASFVSLPSVFWTWLSPARAFSSVQHGFAAGVGVSPAHGLQHTALLVGYTVRYNQNVGIVFGGALHPQKRLSGRYDVHELVSENLNSDALHESEIREPLAKLLGLAAWRSPQFSW